MAGNFRDHENEQRRGFPRGSDPFEKKPSDKFEKKKKKNKERERERCPLAAARNTVRKLARSCERDRPVREGLRMPRRVIGSIRFKVNTNVTRQAAARQLARQSSGNRSPSRDARAAFFRPRVRFRGWIVLIGRGGGLDNVSITWETSSV